ncbi:MAG: MBL fold metallo-hydrolase RNA specificity domain-containing protein [Fimbriimonadaceae bacterium]
MAPSIQFNGAAETVTGSQHVITVNGKRIMVDCGLFQGPREIRERNWEPFAFSPHEIDAVVLTHAHTDHIGLLPRLIAQGYRGPVYATPGTIGLCKISLPDGGRLQEEEASYHNRHQTSRHNPAAPLYTEADAYAALKQLVPVHFFQLHDLPGGAQFRFLPAGHILGSGFAEIYFENGERILMGGDLGRYDTPLLKDPHACTHAEYLVIESTYGDRFHAEENPQDVLREVIQYIHQMQSCAVVPSFAIGRTQELLWHIHELEQRGEIPHIPIFVDSPMASATTLLYNAPSDDMDPDLKLDIQENNSPFRADMVRFIRDRNASKALNTNDGPLMIISGSGMANGGRVVHHLRQRLPHKDNVVLFTGYQAAETRGRRILEGADTISIFGDEIPVRCRVAKLNSLSAHADQNEIMRWLGGFQEAPRKTFIVHGEPTAQAVLAERIQRELGWDYVIPHHQQSFSLG